jgi:hypothetical protein
MNIKDIKLYTVQILFDDQIFYYYEDYAELNQHLKDGFETDHAFIVTKIINQ